jgi:hypothetical protein
MGDEKSKKKRKRKRKRPGLARNTRNAQKPFYDYQVASRVKKWDTESNLMVKKG